MPVQFFCSHCRCRLSVAQRKAGASVACPKCGQPNVVPGSSAKRDEEPPSSAGAPTTAELPVDAAAANIAMPTTVPAEGFLGSSSVVADAAFDDVLQLISDKEMSSAPQAAGAALPQAVSPPLLAFEKTASPTVVSPAVGPPPAPPPIPPIEAFESRLQTALPAPSRGAATRRAGREDGTVLLITRKAVYAQAALMAGMVLLAFVAGYLVGHSGRAASKTAGEPAGGGEPVALEGYVLYSLTPGESMPDAGATVIALPAGKKAERKIVARGLRPGDEDDLSAAPAAEALRSLGAAVARTDNSGQFQLVVPRPGDYSLVIVSHRANRPEGQTIAMSDHDELSHVFASPNELIGQKRYTIVSRRLAGAPPVFTHEFGPTDKK